MPPKRRGRPAKKALSSNAEEAKESQVEDKDAELFYREVERQCAAVRAIRDVELEQTLTGLRLLRSYFNEEQMQTPVLQFFEENLPNLTVLRDDKNGKFEVRWKDEDGNFYMDNADGKDIHASLLHRMSIGYPYCSGAPSFSGYGFSSKAVKTNLLGVDNLQIGDFVLEEPSNSQMFGMHEALRTPGVTSQRLSVGVTPKTLRQPKRGEMLLSVHGSPLGVYEEDNMGAIQESEEG
ncbi:translation initiation factor [Citrus sinensis]|uniref:Borealin C-terminal domain-containing protein n=1 Tax=Citrus clementina TaxID=85681 RepID=V4S1T9_CITCL|nr:uncharacterized protein LOC18037427 [Citrus x clementina]XP_006464319.1 uncharacterized protein LOC102621038 [Citrus sinensis]XP_006464321.1 uncharacterized protein LOC102621038 [Citrus sinensis]XP_024036698.1 uncharacterized protein LOC18037427 [Citrus x clementina]XP_052299940.1 uncharacterized protein LOC102621038 [Citrus sinensis]ESR41313.1 hypothetical protein CICLE_v10026392mg [Citrus x clementina]KAH9669741.1 translation initiation factor [Citrus sinensis]